MTILVTCLLLPMPALAVVPSITANTCAGWGLQCVDLAGIIDYIWRALQVVLGMLATIAAAALMYYGVLYIISTGEEEEARRAKKGVVYAILGIMVVGLAAWIVNAVINL